MALDPNKIKIAKEYQIADIIEQKLGAGTKRGQELLYNCPFHSDKTKSFSVNRGKNVAKCFGCGWGDDSIGFLVSMGSTFHEAVEELSGGVQAFPQGSVLANKSVAVQKIVWKQIINPSTRPKSFSHYKYGGPTMPPFEYKNRDGSLIGFVIRYADGSDKVTLPFIYATDGKRSEWRFQGFDTPRPLYNLDLIEKYPEKTILLVEGEKTADAGMRLLDSFDKIIVTTWPGGTNATRVVNFSPLFGRKVIQWPDNDTKQKYGDRHEKAGQAKPYHEQPGNKAMLEIAEILKPNCPTLKWVDAPGGMPHAWDIADWEVTPHEARNYIINNLKDTPFKTEGIVPTVPVIPLIPEQKEEHVKEPSVPAKKIKSKFENKHFRFLGYSCESGDNSYYFFRESTLKIISMTPGTMSTPNLIQLAPLRWWEEKFPASKGGISINGVLEFLIRTSEEKGSFDTDNIRGRGAWIDGSDIILHCGNHLLVNNVKHPLGSVNDSYMYENGKSFNIGNATAATPAEAIKVRELLSMLNWERSVNAYLLAGWCVVAPVCGALPWRPHVWLTGASGSGKTWIVEKIIEVLLGKTALKVQGSGTSEAGIRQSLNKDARPVVFEEAEGDGKVSQDKIQEILGLMRLASSENGGNLVKGSANGKAANYVIRSCFAFSSIAVQLVQRSDKSRVTVLGLIENKAENRAETWKAILAKYHEVMTDDIAGRIQARTISLLPTIIKNIKTFSNAAAIELGSQRAGDQIGVLLAGAFSLSSSKEISFADAINWIKTMDWSEEKGTDGSKDEQMLIGHIMKQITYVETGDKGKVERTVVELLMIAAGTIDDGIITPDAANSRLKRLGIKYHYDETNPEWHMKLIMISNKNTWIDRCLQGTPWANGYVKILQRIVGARVSEATRFAGTKDRAVILPFSIIE